MKSEYKKALTEVNIILENTEEVITCKIPNEFKNFIKENMDKNHNIKLYPKKELIEQNIMKETKELIALIYRDYVCDEEERKTLVLQEQERREKKEKEEQEKYNIYFKNRLEKRRKKNIIEKLKEENALIEIQEEKWYKKIINKILKIFKIK